MPLAYPLDTLSLSAATLKCDRGNRRSDAVITSFDGTLIVSELSQSSTAKRDAALSDRPYADRLEAFG